MLVISECRDAWDSMKPPSRGSAAARLEKHGTGRFRRDLLERGVSESFVEQAMAMPASAMWYPTADELLKAHVITSVVE
jgi:SOS response regulatory protein OraA/RecX